MMFVYLIGIIAVLSTLIAPGGTWTIYDSATGEPAEAPDYVVSEETFPDRSLRSIEGMRFFFSSYVDNFAGFGVVVVVLISMAGVGVCEHAGLMGALIRRIVQAAPPKWLAFILAFVGVLSSVATDAGYLFLVPLAAAAFLSVGQHPLAGMAAAFAGVGAVFGVNILITPSDSMLTEVTNGVLNSLNMAPTIQPSAQPTTMRMKWSMGLEKSVDSGTQCGRSSPISR
ncbi:AbgT family transporter [Jonesiaceae bacterium BS-20]|uniref:AbgT family transporter n=1 Tax=Jonesiaceae bacterium BS-20 TaxID=3120821 RepID=A0AAU7DRK1_9MICO